MQNVILLIVLIVSIILASVVINKLQQLFMKLIGARVMFFDGKAKIFWILLLGAIIFSLILTPFRPLLGV